MKLFKIFNPNLSESKNKKEKKQADNAVELQEEIIDAIVSYLKQFYGRDFSEAIVIWTTNQRNQVAVRSAGFKDALCLALENANLHEIAKAETVFEFQDPPENNNFHQASGGLFIEIRSRITIPTIAADCKARITAVPGFGSLSQKEYVLDPTQKTVFHIGRGEISRHEAYRINDIVIKPDESDFKQSEKNSNVSGAHADIIFKNNSFRLRAMPRGCRSAGGSATKIVHGDNLPVELEDTITLYPLQHGDLIELGKNVLLKFEITE